MLDIVELRLSQDQALVLSELFSRFEATNLLNLKSNAEFIALSEVAAQIQCAVVQPLRRDYKQLLAEATSRLAAGYEGTAPGVEP